ncbi:hypothetical protein [Gottfriedia solisilvae]|uniref:hypothetical protein n=1 Tax=Gottfriedia solisilvae TaxID=1516104 RepID=UPI003D2EBC03
MKLYSVKLKHGFMPGMSDREACLYANINPSTLYEYCKKNLDFSERKELFKDQLKIKAKVNISNKIIDGDIHLSQWYLERKSMMNLEINKRFNIVYKSE